MSEYKDTLNLPETGFPMRGNLPIVSQKCLSVGTKKIFTVKSVKLRKAKSHSYCTIPPYANGDIHIGHALNKILKDIIIKSKTLSGFDAPYIPGWDCHGLPIELMVEKKVGKPGQK